MEAELRAALACERDGPEHARLAALKKASERAFAIGEAHETEEPAPPPPRAVERTRVAAPAPAEETSQAALWLGLVAIVETVIIAILYFAQDSLGLSHCLLKPAGDAWRMPRGGNGMAPKLGLLAVVVPDEVALKARSGNVAPGCTGAGPGLAIPRRDGAIDFGALRSCARSLKAATPELAEERRVAIAGTPPTPFGDILDVIGALRGETSDLFPEALLSIDTE